MRPGITEPSCTISTPQCCAFHAPGVMRPRWFVMLYGVGSVLLYMCDNNGSVRGYTRFDDVNTSTGMFSQVNVIRNVSKLCVMNVSIRAESFIPRRSVSALNCFSGRLHSISTTLDNSLYTYETNILYYTYMLHGKTKDEHIGAQYFVVDAC